MNRNRLMSIGEIAKSLKLTRRIILNYEEKGLLTADQKNGTTGNRYYSADMIAKIRTIRVLQNLGLSLDEIKLYFSGKTDLLPLIRRLEVMRDELNLNIEKLKERVKHENGFEVQSVVLPAQTVYMRTLQADTVEERKEHLRDIIPAAIRQYGSNTEKRMFFIEYTLESPNLISYCIAVPPGSKGEYIHALPEKKALCIYYHGSYESIPEIRDKILAYAAKKHIATENVCRHIYLEGPAHHTDSNKFITQVALPIKFVTVDEA